MKTVASICTGGGLADIGFQAAGYRPIWGIENNPAIAEVASHNLKHQIYVESMVRFNWWKLDRPNHLHISPPCQNASVANPNGGEGEVDKAIAISCCTAISELKPDTFSLENVSGYRKFWGFQKIVDTLWELGYWVNVDVLDAADFGVPQNRKRLILRAVLGGFPAPLPESKQWRGWYEAIADLIPSLPESSFAQWQLDRMPEIFGSVLTDSGKNSTRNATVRHSDEPSFCVVANAMQRPSHTPKAFLVDGTPNDHGKTVTVRQDNSPCFTICASNKKAARTWNEGRVVTLNARCLARLQTLPDWYELPDRPVLASKIIGNGFPCDFAAAIAGGE